MDGQIDIRKLVTQHIEMDSFFVGDFAIRGNEELSFFVAEPDVPAVTEKPAMVTPPGPMETVASSVETPSFIQEDDSEDIMALDSLEAIAQKVARCKKCQLHATRNHTVAGQGHPEAKLVFVGEAPGADEDRQGVPFVGRAGKMLTKIIEAMGVTREDVFICNILKCRPPGNRDPKPDEIIKCEPYLKRQLELLQPKVIVALGAHAARTLLKTNKPIGRLRGMFHEYKFSDKVVPAKLMPTYHPAYLLRNYSNDNRKRVWEDMQKVMKELGLEAPK